MKPEDSLSHKIPLLDPMVKQRNAVLVLPTNFSNKHINLSSSSCKWCVPVGKHDQRRAFSRSSFSVLSFLDSVHCTIFENDTIFQSITCFRPQVKNVYSVWSDKKSSKVPNWTSALHLRMGEDPDSETLCSILEQWEIYEIPKDSISKCVLEGLSCEATGCFLPLQWPDTIKHLREINPSIRPPIRPSIHPYISLWLYSLVLDFGRFSFSWFFTWSVGSLGRGISPSQGCYLHTQDIINTE